MNNKEDTAKAVVELARAYSILYDQRDLNKGKPEREAVSQALVVLCLFDLNGHHMTVPALKQPDGQVNDDA